MTIRLRVKDYGIGLCSTCRNSRIAKGTNRKGGPVTRMECGYFENIITMTVTECNQYLDATTLTLRELKPLAWILVQDPKRKSMGFVHPKDVKDSEKWRVLPGEDD